MRSERTDYVRHGETDDLANIAPAAWQRPRPAARYLRTELSDEVFAACGLRVLSKVDPARLLNTHSDANPATREAEQWLVPDAANDLVAPQAPEWLAVLLQRLDDLRAIAADEGLPLDELSVDAALAFLRRLPGVRQPGAFLIGGNLRLVWDRPGGEQVGLQFRGADTVQYIIFQQDGGVLGSMMGIKSADAVARIVLAADVLPLMAR